jgi:hypothetical protein
MIDIAESFGLDARGDLTVVENAEAVRSHIAARLRHILGEDYYAQEVGVPWFSGMFSPATSYEQKAGILRSVVAKTPGVTAIINFTFGIDPVDRRAVVEYSARTIYDEVIIDEVAL